MAHPSPSCQGHTRQFSCSLPASVCSHRRHGCKVRFLLGMLSPHPRGPRSPRGSCGPPGRRGPRGPRGPRVMTFSFSRYLFSYLLSPRGTKSDQKHPYFVNPYPFVPGCVRSCVWCRTSGCRWTTWIYSSVGSSFFLLDKAPWNRAADVLAVT